MDDNAKTKIEYEISRIEKSLISVKPLLDLCKTKEPDIIEMTALAQVLHSFYNGVEGIIVLFFESLGEEIPNDSKWHKTLFEMAFGSNSGDIKIVGDDIKTNLEKYLLFRQFIRCSYSSELNWTEMEPLIKGIEGIWKIIKIDFDKIMKQSPPIM